MKKFYRYVWVLTVWIATALVVGCKEKHPVEQPSRQLEEKVFVVNIVPDSLKLKAYLDYHKNIWPQVEAGFKKAGYKKIVLYRYQHLLVMTITVPVGADLQQMGKLAESSDPRCAEWNKLMNEYQTGVAGTSTGQTWVEAKPFYTFNNL
jgi:L-rhamnose mutarotase